MEKFFIRGLGHPKNRFGDVIAVMSEEVGNKIKFLAYWTITDTPGDKIQMVDSQNAQYVARNKKHIKCSRSTTGKRAFDKDCLPQMKLFNSRGDAKFSASAFLEQEASNAEQDTSDAEQENSYANQKSSNVELRDCNGTVLAKMSADVDTPLVVALQVRTDLGANERKLTLLLAVEISI